jgi:4-hydroxy-tetrahydrodipicolinate synthase
MINAYFANDIMGALALHEALLPLSQAMFIETNPIPVKTAMNLLGMNAGPLRLPLAPMSERNKTELVAVLQKNGFSVR